MILLAETFEGTIPPAPEPEPAGHIPRRNNDSVPTITLTESELLVSGTALQIARCLVDRVHTDQDYQALIIGLAANTEETNPAARLVDGQGRRLLALAKAFCAEQPKTTEPAGLLRALEQVYSHQRTIAAARGVAYILTSWRQGRIAVPSGQQNEIPTLVIERYFGAINNQARQRACLTMGHLLNTDVNTFTIRLTIQASLDTTTRLETRKRGLAK